MGVVVFGEAFGGPLFVEAALVSDGFGALFCSGMRKAPLNVVSGAIVVDSSSSEETRLRPHVRRAAEGREQPKDQRCTTRAKRYASCRFSDT